MAASHVEKPVMEKATGEELKGHEWGKERDGPVVALLAACQASRSSFSGIRGRETQVVVEGRRHRGDAQATRTDDVGARCGVNTWCGEFKGEF